MNEMSLITFLRLFGDSDRPSALLALPSHFLKTKVSTHKCHANFANVECKERRVHHQAARYLIQIHTIPSLLSSCIRLLSHC